MDVAKYFSDPDAEAGESLSYSASSSKPAVATAGASGSVVTVTAVAAGDAVVTVTATAADGLSAMLMFMVTVMAADDGPADLTLEVDEKDTVDAADYFDAAEDAKYEATRISGQAVSVAKKAGTDSEFEIKAINQGESTVELAQIVAGSRMIHKLSVTVPNPAPKLLAATARPPVSGLSITSCALAPGLCKLVNFALSTFFTDDDALTFSITSLNTTKVTASIKNDAAILDVRQLDGDATDMASFRLSATDSEGAESADYLEFDVSLEQITPVEFKIIVGPNGLSKAPDIDHRYGGTEPAYDRVRRRRWKRSASGV